jgi:hypothetical protein
VVEGVERDRTAAESGLLRAAVNTGDAVRLP